MRPYRDKNALLACTTGLEAVGCPVADASVTIEKVSCKVGVVPYNAYMSVQANNTAHNVTVCHRLLSARPVQVHGDAH